MRLANLPSYLDRKAKALAWLQTLPAGSWHWVTKYPYEICINQDADALVYKLLFEL